MSWSTSLPRMKPPCVVKPLHLCSPKATRSRKRRRNSCFHNLNGYLCLLQIYHAWSLILPHVSRWEGLISTSSSSINSRSYLPSPTPKSANGHPHKCCVNCLLP